MAIPFGQLIVDGLGMGLIYVILAAGLVLMMNVAGIFLVAYGELFSIGAFIVWSTMDLLKLPFLIALGIAILATTLLGLAMQRFIFQYIQYAENKFLAMVAVSIGLMMILAQAILLIFGTVPRKAPSIFSGMVTFAGINISIEKIVLMVIALITTLAIVFVYEKTKIGRAMRAVSFNSDVASLQGVNTNMIYLMTMGLCAALAGFAGGTMAPVYAVFPEMGRNVFLFILLVVMLGGTASIAGAVLGGIVLGITLSFGLYFAGGLSQILLFIIVGIIIFFRPGGILGRKAEFEV